MNPLGGRVDRPQPASKAESRPSPSGKTGKSGEGARSALEQLILQETARELARAAEELPRLPLRKQRP